MTIKAPFNGKCKSCKKNFPKGSEVAKSEVINKFGYKKYSYTCLTCLVKFRKEFDKAMDKKKRA